jgi:hypothetical protein
MAASSRRVGAHLGRVAHGAGHLPALVFPASVRRLWVALVVSIVFVAVGLAILVTAGSS